MKIYTKTGDAGETGLLSGPRVLKHNVRIEAYGTVDELNSVLGLVRSEEISADLDRPLNKIQHDLFRVGAELAAPQPDKLSLETIGDPDILALEKTIDQLEVRIDPLRQFILPGGTRPAASLHLARTICRRAERCVVGLRESVGEAVSERLVCYLNRLGDLLFVMARVANADRQVSDVIWDPVGEFESNDNRAT